MRCSNAWAPSLALALSLLGSAAAAVEPPFHVRQVENQRDVGAINENFKAVADAARAASLSNGGVVSGVLDLSGTGAMIRFPDGTTQTTAATSATRNSSYTSVSDGSHDAGTKGTTYSVAYATVSFTANNVDLKVCANICFRTNGASAMGGWSILVNGAFPTGTNLTSTRGIKAVQIDTANQCISASSCYRFPAQGSGTKNFALVIAAPNGSITSWDDNDAAGNMDTQFEVFEPYGNSD